MWVKKIPSYISLISAIKAGSFQMKSNELKPINENIQHRLLITDNLNLSVLGSKILMLFDSAHQFKI